MIARLTGRLVAVDGVRCVIDVHGVGYEVLAPARAVAPWRDAGDAAVAYVSTQVREDAITLFGFSSDDDRALFVLLLGVTGVGPRLALACLDGMTSDALTRALATGDVKRLAQTPGIGKKTAERLVLELKDKVGAVSMVGGAAPAAPYVARAADPLAAALTGLGYDRAEQDRAQAALREQDLGPDKPIADRLRAALKVLYKGAP